MQIELERLHRVIFLYVGYLGKEEEVLGRLVAWGVCVLERRGRRGGEDIFYGGILYWRSMEGELRCN